jgi:hypothetical protein
MLELLLRLEYKRQALRRRTLGTFPLREGSYSAIGVMLVIPAIIAGPSLFLAFPAVHFPFILTYDFVMVGLIMLGILCLCTVIMAPLGLVFL